MKMFFQKTDPSIANTFQIFLLVTSLQSRYKWLNLLFFLFGFRITILGTGAKWLAVLEEKGVKPSK